MRLRRRGFNSMLLSAPFTIGTALQASAQDDAALAYFRQAKINWRQAEGQSLTLTLDGTPSLGVVAALEDASGKAVPLVVSTDDGRTRIAAAKVAPGRYAQRVEEPPLDALPEIIELLARKGKNDFLRGFRVLALRGGGKTRNYVFSTTYFEDPKRRDKVRIPIIYDIRGRE